MTLRFQRRRMLAICVALAASCCSAQERPSEYQVKAAYLYNFGKFVNWPAPQPSSDPFSICVLGHDPFGAQLDAVIANATINEKKIAAKRISDAAEASGCQIVFVSSSEAPELDRILPVLAKFRALTVSDIPKFVQHNGMIQFVIDSGRVRFEVNQAAAENAGLTLSSQLLKVASSVKRSRSGAD